MASVFYVGKSFLGVEQKLTLTFGGGESIAAFHTGRPLELADNTVGSFDLVPELQESVNFEHYRYDTKGCSP